MTQQRVMALMWLFLSDEDDSSLDVSLSRRSDGVNDSFASSSAETDASSLDESRLRLNQSEKGRASFLEVVKLRDGTIVNLDLQDLSEFATLRARFGELPGSEFYGLLGACC